VPGSDVWTRSFRLPADARFTYAFAPDFPLTRVPVEEFERLRWRIFADPLNPRRVGLQQSLCELPNAPASPWTVPSRDVPAGAVTAHRVASRQLGNERLVHVYTPPGYTDTGGPYPLVVCFDGVDYLAGIPAPTILDNLIAHGRLPPTMALMIEPIAAKRDAELLLDESFTEVVGREIVPWVQRRYRATADPRAVVVCGFSAGGLASVFAAFRHPDVFGNVLAQSAARFPRPDGLDVYEWLAQKIASAPARPTRYLLEEGLPDPSFATTPPFRYLAPVLAGLESSAARV